MAQWTHPHQRAMMRALVVDGPHTFSVRDVERPRPGPYEVLCRVRATAICGTDPHIIAGEFPGFWPKDWPLIPGHEWCGEIVELGEGAAALGWSTGTRVAGTSHAPCGFCARCVEGRYNVCEYFGVDGLHAQYGHNAPGAYAEYVVHSVRSVFPVPDELSDEEVAMLDPAAIALHTVVRGAHRPGDTVVVVGPGVMGLLVAECAQALGAGRVLVVGRGPRLDKARGLGHETIDFTRGDPVAAVRERTGGADVALECSGAPQAVAQCVEMVRKGGRVAIIGIPLADAQVPMPRTVLDEIDVVGVRAAAGEMPRAIRLAAEGRIRLRELVTHRFPLEDFAEAYATFTERRDGALKVIVRPGAEMAA
ncbi:MAG TPA: alcohol dehydrogenase catalytic domain-containing protein [Solirubrobacteraceae bacterium]|nr:alcohol dehydrogenase catalytic domain-containing protein [Solirubrobacteraceae bacterium]